jgi:hypothetical protein
MSPRRRHAFLILALVTLSALLVAPDALASAGGGSSGFSGGGGGGGGGNGFFVFILVDLLFHIAVIGHGLGLLFLIACGLVYLFVTRLLPKLNDDWHTRAAQRTPRARRPERSTT